MNDHERRRREVLAGLAGAGALLIGTGAARPAFGEAKKKAAAEDIPPTEDLMREHGVLRRILIVYGEAARKIDADASVVAVIARAAGIVRRFVEGYHEKLEEEFVLPKLETAGKLGELTKTIRAQHIAGRKLTDAILKDAKAGKAASGEQRRAIITSIQAFGRMYGAHAAWEDTELFPVYRAMFSEAQLDELGERFEAQEHKLRGGGGFEGSLKEVGDLEKALGVHDLAVFTPRV
jgi:hemerythrin-like domain-containing protein